MNTTAKADTQKKKMDQYKLAPIGKKASVIFNQMISGIKDQKDKTRKNMRIAHHTVSAQIKKVLTKQKKLVTISEYNDVSLKNVKTHMIFLIIKNNIYPIGYYSAEKNIAEKSAIYNKNGLIYIDPKQQKEHMFFADGWLSGMHRGKQGKQPIPKSRT